MAEDIVPALYERIKRDYTNGQLKNRKIQNFLKKLEKKTAEPREVSLYAAELGKCASDALVRNLTPEQLPDEKLYWNIADRTIWPLLEEVHEAVMNAAVAVQKVEDEKTGIHLKPIRSEFPRQRVHDLLEKLIGILEEENDGGEME